MTSTDQCSMLWRVAGRSVRGCSHERLGVPNQDALHWLPQEDLSRVVFLAVSDGHGSAKSFRSEIGSHIAVEVLTEGMHQFSETATAQSLPLPEIQQIAEESLPASLVRQWREKSRHTWRKIHLRRRSGKDYWGKMARPLLQRSEEILFLLTARRRLD